MTADPDLPEPPPKWAVFIARAVAIVTVVPVRLAWEWLCAFGRLLRRLLWHPLARVVTATWRRLSAGAGTVFGFLWHNGLRPVLVAVRQALTWLCGLAWRGVVGGGRLLVVAPLRWLWQAVIVPAAVAVGRSGRWVGRTLVVAPLRWLWQAVIVPAATALGRGGRLAGRGLVRVLDAVLVGPLGWLWRTTVRPAARSVGHALGWLARHAGTALAGSWAWVSGLVRRGLRGGGTILRLLVLSPLGWVGRNLLLKPLALVFRALVVALGWLFWRLAAVLRLFWRAACWAGDRVAMPVWRLLVTACRLVFVVPARWLYSAVLTPAGHLVRWAWRAAVVRPARWVRRTLIEPVREAGRGIRRQIAAAFRRRAR